MPEAGGSSNPTAPINEVNFYDYDGTILYSYTVEEAQALTELPPLPTQPGLICQEWNYDLETIKSYNRPVNIGATYINDDGKTRLYIRIAAEGRMQLPLYFSQTVSNGVTIDWGDGSDTQTLSGTGAVNTTHTYTSIGDHVISLDVSTDCMLEFQGNRLEEVNILGDVYKPPNAWLKKIEIGKNIIISNCALFNAYAYQGINILCGITSIGRQAFGGCKSLTSITIPNSVTSIGDGAFDDCRSLSSITIPDSVTSIGNYAFNYCYSLISITIPDSVTRIGNYAFCNCSSLTSITIPDSVTSIGSYAFAGCLGMAIYDFTLHTFIPALFNQNAFQSIPSDCVIKVPAALYDKWITATNWSTYADHIVPV